MRITSRTLLRMRMLAMTLCLAAVSGAAMAREGGTCAEPRPGSDKAPLLSPPRGNVVTGTGRLQFYSAPSPRCAMAGVFVISGDELMSYAQTDDAWTSVTYMGARQADVSGWVRSERLKETGTMGR